MNNEEELALKLFEKHELRFGEILKRIHWQMDKRANHDMQKWDLTLTQFRMLVMLDMSPDGSANLKSLERFFKTAQSTTAGTVSRLEKKGFIESYHSPNDKRIKCVRLTEKGKKCNEDLKEMFDTREAQMLSALTPDEQKQLIDYLKKIYERLEAD